MHRAQEGDRFRESEGVDGYRRHRSYNDEPHHQHYSDRGLDYTSEYSHAARAYHEQYDYRDDFARSEYPQYRHHWHDRDLPYQHGRERPSPPRVPTRHADVDERRHDGHYQDRYVEAEQQQEKPTPASELRLVKLASDVLPEAQTVAIIDGREEGVSIGRDRSFTARIRCPSMEISKHHANIFKMATDIKNNKARDTAFAIADTGSTHGTYLLLNPPSDLSLETLPDISIYERLSETKKASMPKALRHMCLLRVGQTIFQAHLHAGRGASCEDCAISVDGRNEIPLLVKEKEDKKTAQNTAGLSSVPANDASNIKVAPKQALKDLKARHLRDEASAAAPSESHQYVDRAAARRARVGVQAPSKDSQAHPKPIPAGLRSSVVPVQAPVSGPAAKLDASNRGYQMFASMTSKSGEAKLPADLDPIMARGVEGRAGLGSKRLLDEQEMASRSVSGYGHDSIRERQRRRYEEAR